MIDFALDIMSLENSDPLAIIMNPPPSEAEIKALNEYALCPVIVVCPYCGWEKIPEYHDCGRYNLPAPSVVVLQNRRNEERRIHIEILREKQWRKAAETI